MYIDGKPVLHLVDDSTRFSAARLLSSVSTESTWEANFICWATVYTGLPHTFMVDQGSEFQKTFAKLSELHEVKVGYVVYKYLHLSNLGHQPTSA